MVFVLSAVLILMLGLYAAAGFWLVPRLAEQHLAPWLSQRYGVHLTLERVRFNPFNFQAHARGISLTGPDGAALLQVDSVALDYEPTALLHRTWKFKRLALTGLNLDMVLAKNGELNLAVLLQRLVSQGAAPANATSGPPVRLVIDQLETTRASVQFTEVSGSGNAKVSIAPIAFSMTGLSTLPGAKASHTLSAALADGGVLTAQGEVVLEPALSANGQFKLRSLKAATWLPFLRSALRIDRLKGSADLSAHYAYAATPGLQLDQVNLSVADLLLAAPGVAKPLATLQRITASGGTLDLKARNVALADLVLSHGRASLSVASDGRVAWSLLLPPEPGAVAPAGAADSAGPDWNVVVADARLDAVAVDYDDQQRKPTLQASIARIDGAMQFALTAGAHTDFKASAMTVRANAISVPAPSAGGPMLQIDSAAVKGGSLDLKGMQVAAQDLSLDGGTIAIARDADGSIDWVRRFSSVKVPSETADAAASWHYDIDRIGVKGVDVVLADRSQAPAFAYGLRVASATAQHVASDGTEPIRFDTQLVAQPGGTLRARGNVATSGADLQANVQLDKLELAPFYPLVKRYTGFSLSGGPLTLSADLQATDSLVIDHLSADLPGFALRQRSVEEPLLSAARLALQDAQLRLAQRQLVIGRMTLAQGALRAHRHADGRFDWQGDAVTPMAPSGIVAGPAAADPPAPWSVRIDALNLQEMAAHYVDDTSKAPVRLDASKVDLTARLQLTAGGADTQLLAQGLQTQLQSVALSTGRENGAAVALASVSLSGGQFDLQKRQIAASRVAVMGGTARIARDADGNIDLLNAFGPGQPVDAATEFRPSAVGTPWQYAVDTIEVQKFGIDAKDQSYSSPLALNAQLDATVTHLSNTSPTTFDASLSLADDAGSIRASGTATLDSGAVQARLVAKSFALVALQPLIARYTTLALQKGRAATDVEITHAPGASDALQASGQISVEDLVLNQASTDAHVLSIERLDAQQLTFASGTRSLRIEQIDLVHPDAQIAIAKDRSVNLSEWIRHSDDDVATVPSATAVSVPGLNVAVQRIQVRNGSVDYSDQSLVLPFATKVKAITASIVGVSSDNTRRAEVQAKGSIQSYGSASVDGSIVPSDPRRFTDLRVKFNNVLVAPFSPYTATFAGRKVESGKLWLDLEYKIDQNQLLGKNDIRLDDFTLGERVDSQSAIDLPLDLAVSLLTDSKGEIHLAVPVRGDLGKPHFEIGGAIAQAIGNAIGRIVTAPFRLLGELFGGGKGLASINFAPGSAALVPEQREKLDTLTRALQQRPLLRLVVAAPYDAKADTLALQSAEARRQLALQMGRVGYKDAGDAPVAFDDPDTRAALRALLAKPGVSNSDQAAAGADDDRASYEEMFERIAKEQPLGMETPQVLATRRARQIAQYLTQQGIDGARVQTGQVQAVAVGDDGMVDAALTASAKAP